MKHYLTLNSFPLIIADESTDARITEALGNSGYKVFSIQQLMQGIEDNAIIKISIEKDGSITKDNDFGDEIVFRKVPNNGAMLLRLAGVEIQ